MKYNFFVLFLLASCINYSTSGKNNIPFSSKGFAFIDSKDSTNSKNDPFFIAHDSLKIGTKIKIINPENKKFLEGVIIKKIKYDNFYKILLSESAANALNLPYDFPYVEISEIKLNKSFVAKKAITDEEEKKIANTAPLSKINVNNISQNKKIKSAKLRTYSILVAEFYNLYSAEILKEKLALILKDSNYQLIYIVQKSAKKYELLMGPYNTINKLKNDYITLSNSNFEDLDIKIND